MNECNAPPAIPNGSFRESPPYFQGIWITYDCDKGYQMKGQGVSQCQLDPFDPGRLVWEPFPAYLFECENKRSELDVMGQPVYDENPEWLTWTLGGIMSGVACLIMILMIIAICWCMGCCSNKNNKVVPEDYTTHHDKNLHDDIVLVDTSGGYEYEGYDEPRQPLKPVTGGTDATGGPITKVDQGVQTWNAKPVDPRMIHTRVVSGSDSAEPQSRSHLQSSIKDQPRSPVIPALQMIQDPDPQTHGNTGGQRVVYAPIQNQKTQDFIPAMNLVYD